MSAWVWLARIRRPQGRKGEVLAEILTDFPEKFNERKKLWLLADNAKPRSIELLHHWPHKGAVVLHFAGIESISDAENLAGLVVAIPMKERAALGEDEVYIADLIGCDLIDISSAEPVVIGKIENVDRTAGPTPLLIVSGKHGEILIPFAKSYLRKLDLAGGRVDMALPEGLLDLNS